MAETRVDPNQLRRVAKEIEALMDNQKIFTELGGQEPNAGKFDTARWLEFVFKDRRDGVVQHVKYLELACAEIATGLVTIANAFERVDKSNGQAIEAFNQLALDTVNGMDDADFTPLMSQAPPSDNFDSGDDKPTNDSGVKIDGDKVLIDGEPFKGPGMDKFQNVDLAGDKPVINLADAPDGRSEGAGKPNVADTHLSNGSDASDYRPGGAPPPAGGGGGGDKPTGANFNADVEPDKSTYPPREYDYRGRTYTVYDIDGKQQTSPEGWPVLWYNGEPYYDKNGNGHPDKAEHR